MTIQQCKYVLAIADTGSFNEAAKQMFVAQPSLSSSIKALEQELGIKIFERSNNGVFLTDAGTEFVRYASEIVEHENFVVRRYATEDTGNRLYISTQHYDFIADIFGRFITKTKDDSYRLSLRETRTYDVIHDTQTGYSDIGILAIKDGDFSIMKRYLEKNGLKFTPFLKAKAHVFLRNEHPLANSEKLTFAELLDYPYVSYDQGKNNSSFFTEEIGGGINSPKHIEISDRATLMNALLLSDCYTIGTGIMPSVLNEGKIRTVPLDTKEYYIIGYVICTGRRLSETAHNFIDFLCESVKSI